MSARPCHRLLAAGALLATPALADQWADMQAAKQLKCGTFADVPPFAAPDPKTREMVGFDVDMCRALAKHLGVAAAITPLSVEARVPEVQMGRVDITVANLAYTTSRASQIAFSDPYYVAKEMLAVKASNEATTPEDLKGKRLSAAKGSTSELSINLNGSEPVTFQDTGSAYMAVQQNKSQGIVANTMTITKLVNQSKVSGTPMKMIKDPHAAGAGGDRAEEGRGHAAGQGERGAVRHGQGRRDRRAVEQVAGPGHRVQAHARRDACSPSPPSPSRPSRKACGPPARRRCRRGANHCHRPGASMTPPDRFRALLAEPGFIAMPAVWDGLSAKLAAQAGFPDRVHVRLLRSGARLGGPDLDLISFGEMFNSLDMIRGAAPDLLVLADGDHGYGNAMNVQRTVRAYGRLGAAAVLIEDKITPRALTAAGKPCLPREEARMKVRAAVEAAKDSGILVMARTDCRPTAGIDEALARIEMFVAEGADILFFDSPTDEAEIRRASLAAQGRPCFAVLSPGASARDPDPGPRGGAGPEDRHLPDGAAGRGRAGDQSRACRVEGRQVGRRRRHASRRVPHHLWLRRL